MGLNGKLFVLESNGTPVETEVLPYMKNEVLLLLQEGEKWEPVIKDDLSLPSTSTLTYVTTDSPIGELNIFDNQEHQTLDKTEVTAESTQAITTSVFTIPTENVVISESVDCNAENWWKNFKIPWEKLSNTQIKKFEDCIKDPTAITKLVQVVVDEMRCYKKHIPISAFKVISKKIIDPYSLIFLDVDRDGIILGDGTHKLVQKLIDRNNYLNRPIYKRMADDNDMLNPVKNKKKLLSARAGCSNWAPEVLTSDASIEEKKTTENDSDFYNVLEKNYPIIRKYLNSAVPPTIADIKQEWPIILSYKSIKWHFNKLTNSNIELLDRLDKDTNAIHLITITRIKNLEGQAEQQESAEESAMCSLSLIAQYFKENIDSFVLKNKVRMVISMFKFGIHK